MNFAELENLIKENLKDATVEISDLTGTGDHLGLSITSNEFKGKNLLAQHRMVMDILKEELKDRLHAVKLKTQTYE
ncbi:MAG: BolA/IbaG family iron-sulfur metabolism protein [Bacteriovoracaceae bacterium]